MSQKPIKRGWVTIAMIGAISGALGALVGTVVTYGTMSGPSAKKPARVIRAQRYEVVGSDGVVRGVLCAMEPHGAELELVSDDPGAKATLRCTDEPSLHLRTGSGAHFGIEIEPETGEFEFTTAGTAP